MTSIIEPYAALVQDRDTTKPATNVGNGLWLAETM